VDDNNDYFFQGDHRSENMGEIEKLRGGQEQCSICT